MDHKSITGELTDDLHNVYKELKKDGNQAVEDYENFKKENFTAFKHNMFLMDERRGPKSAFVKDFK